MRVSGPSLLSTSEASVMVLASRRAERLWEPLPAAGAEAGIASAAGVGAGVGRQVEGARGVCAWAPVRCGEVKGGFSLMKRTQGHMAEQPENVRCAALAAHVPLPWRPELPQCDAGPLLPLGGACPGNGAAASAHKRSKP